MSFTSLILLIVWICVSSEEYDISGMVEEEERYLCEFEAVRYGSRLADVFNSVGNNSDFEKAYYQSYLIEHTGFGDNMAGGIYEKGESSEGVSSSKLREKGGWEGYGPLEKSSYWALENKWIYIHGESTSKQLFGALHYRDHYDASISNLTAWSKDNVRQIKYTAFCLDVEYSHKLTITHHTVLSPETPTSTYIEERWLGWPL